MLPWDKWRRPYENLLYVSYNSPYVWLVDEAVYDERFTLCITHHVGRVQLCQLSIR